MDRFSVVFSLEIPADWGPFARLLDAFPSGMRDAGTIRFPLFCDPKQDSPPKQPPHLLRWHKNKHVLDGRKRKDLHICNPTQQQT